MKFDEIQQLVVANYNNGDHLVEKPDDVENCGDGLLKFLLVELSTAEDCHSPEEAILRLGTAIHELQTLSEAIQVQA